MTTTADTTIARALTLKPAARAKLIGLMKADEVAAMHEQLLGGYKARTPRPVLERRVLAELDKLAKNAAEDEAAMIAERAEAERLAAAQPDEDPRQVGYPRAADTDPLAELEARAETEGMVAVPVAAEASIGHDPRISREPLEGDPDESAGHPVVTIPLTDVTPAPKKPRAQLDRLPPVGTIIQKADRHGAVRCECEVIDGGVRYAGKNYTSISAAANAAAVDLGLTCTTLNGFLWWGLDQAPRAPRVTDPTLVRTRLQAAIDALHARGTAAIELVADEEQRQKYNRSLDIACAEAGRLLAIVA